MTMYILALLFRSNMNIIDLKSNAKISMVIDINIGSKK
jgi:hypothetical protein